MLTYPLFVANSATPQMNPISCTDLTTKTQLVLKPGQSECQAGQAAAIWHIQNSDGVLHSGPGVATIKICSSKTINYSYQYIRTSCPRYQNSTDYWRSISLPVTPLIKSSVANGANGAILFLTSENLVTDAPVAYYFVKNLLTGEIKKVFSSRSDQVIIENLQPSTAYIFEITAVNLDGVSNTSSKSNLIITSLPAPASSAPSSAQALAAPAFTLSATSESRLVNTPATGFTINSTGGAISSFTISATPPGMNFNSTTGQLSGTPNVAAAATTYTVTGTNAAGSTSKTFTLTVTNIMVDGITYVSNNYSLGDTGPGGGKIFYVAPAGTSFACGPTLSAQCRYLEAAKNYWLGGGAPMPTDTTTAWSSVTNVATGVDTATTTAIGAGYKNSLIMINQPGSGSRNAATIAREYSGGGYSDWYLPSIDELTQINANRVTSGLSFSQNYLWSSSEFDASTALYLIIGSASKFTTAKSWTSGNVRPIRAIGSLLPNFALSATYETRTVNTVATGFTVSSVGATIDSFSISSVPAGMSFNTTTGELSGTPTVISPGTSYTVTATNSAGSTTRTFTLKVVTDVYTIGSIGPGGGIVFYADNAVGFSCGASYTSTGSPTGGLCHYLEVAPANWNGGTDPSKVWAVAAETTTAVIGINNDSLVYNDALGIGLGYKNSNLIVTQGNDSTTAAGAARAYVGGSLNDWYLPTSTELNLLCQWDRGITANAGSVCNGGTLNSATLGAGIAGIQNAYYWSSSQQGSVYAWYQWMGGSFQGPANKNSYILGSPTAILMRPIRAF